MRWYFLVIFLVLFIGIVKADVIDINLERESYLLKETFQADLIVNNKLDSSINVFDLKLSKNGNKIPVAFYINKIDNNFYRVYFQIPENLEGDYEFSVNNIDYYENNILKQGRFFNNFSVIKQNGVGISDGFLLLNKGETKVLDINNYQNEMISISVTKSSDNVLLDKNNLAINKNSQDNLQIMIDKNKEYKYLNNIDLSYQNKSYNVLILYLGEGKSANNSNNFNSTIIVVNNTQGDTTQEIVYDVLNFDDPELEIDKQLNDNEKDLLNGWINIRNFGDKDVKDINIFVTGNVKDIITIKNELNEVKENSLGIVYIDINKEHNAVPGIYGGNFVLNYSVFEHKIPIRIEYIGIENNENFNETQNNNAELFNKTEPPVEIKDNKGKILLFIIIFLVLIALIVLIIAYRKRNINKKSF